MPGTIVAQRAVLESPSQACVSESRPTARSASLTAPLVGSYIQPQIVATATSGSTAGEYRNERNSDRPLNSSLSAIARPRPSAIGTAIVTTVQRMLFQNAC